MSQVSAKSSTQPQLPSQPAALEEGSYPEPEAEVPVETQKAAAGELLPVVAKALLITVEASMKQACLDCGLDGLKKFDRLLDPRGRPSARLYTARLIFIRALADAMQDDDFTIELVRVFGNVSRRWCLDKLSKAQELCEVDRGLVAKLVDYIKDTFYLQLKQAA